jgi:hypothetical protein
VRGCGVAEEDDACTGCLALRIDITPPELRLWRKGRSPSKLRVSKLPPLQECHSFCAMRASRHSPRHFQIGA